jgi:hypothetical protein
MKSAQWICPARYGATRYIWQGMTIRSSKGFIHSRRRVGPPAATLFSWQTTTTR